MVRATFKPTRERKQRRKAQSQQQPESEQQRSVADLASHSHDPNAEIIIPSTDAKAQRRAELLSSMALPKMSSKKAKRLNKYIENKLRKEETNALLAKLAETKVDTSLFVSAKDIGKAKETKKEKVRRALAELDKGLRGTNADEILFVEREVRGIEEWEEVVGRREQNEDEAVSDIIPSTDMEVEVKATSVENANTQSTEEQQEQRIQDSAAHERALLEKSFVVSTAGSGLKRPLELDESGKPILKKIKRTKAPHELVRATPAPVKFDYDKQDEEMRDGDSEEEDEDEDDEFSMDEDEKENGKEANDVDEDDEEAEEWYGFSDSVNGENGVEAESPAEGTPNSDSSDISDDESEEGAGGEESGDEDEDDEDEQDEDDEDEQDEDDDEESDEGPIPLLKKGTSAAASAFKAWAESARLKALGIDEPKSENNTLIFPKLPAGVTLPRRASSSSPPPQPLPPSSTTLKPASYVTVNRPENIQLSRLALPIVALEQPIMETISTNSTVVICGATGSGKTTQVPQFLFEAGYGNPKSEDTPGLIGITQPRRVAAVSMAKRVQEELGEEHAVKVGYQIRFEGTVGSETAIKFMTDGVLLRELAKDFLLSKYSAIVIDEAHERGVNTDILIGVMSRVVKLREEMHKEDPTKTKLLKLIIMSATLRVSDFTENKSLFSTPPPVINAEARQFPVSVHFSRRTSRDYVDEAYRKISKMHRRLPSGGILVFLTGQNEIQYLMKRLRKAYPLPKAEKEEEEKNEKEPKVKILASEAVIETEDVEFTSTTDSSIHKILTEEGEDERLGEADIDFVSDSDDESDLGDAEQEGRENTTGDPLGEGAIAPLHILPLYSLLPTAQQLRIFSPPPPGHRLCVLATNIAETSLTIPNISYVVDTGRVKSRTYNKSTGVTSYDITWVSKASASQRAGRAGRTGPGHCYRLYSSAVYERDFDQFAVPEIMQMPIEGVVLQMKGMNIEKVVNFPFPTPPEKEELRRAERVLGYLGALKPPTNNTTDVGVGMLTDMGRTMTMFPLPPRFAKILIIGQQHGCLPYVIAIVAALSIGELFIPEHQLNLPAGADDEDEEENQDTNKPVPSVAENFATSRAQAQRKAYYAAQRTFSQLDPTCDVLRLLAVVCAFEYEYSVSGSSSAEAWCGSHYLRYKGMLETRRLRKQLTDIVKSNCPGAAAALVPPKSKNGTKQLQKPLNSLVLDPPSQIQIKALKQIIAAGFIDQIAIRADLLPPGSCGTADPLPPLKKYNRMATVPFVPLNPPSENTPFAFIHPSSSLAQVHPTTAPQFIIYSALTVAGNASVTSTPGRVRMLPLTPLASGKIVAALAKGTKLLSYSKPLGGKIDVVATEGGGQRKEVWVKQLLRREGGAGGVCWELGVEKVEMVKKGGGWVVEEK